MPYSSSLTTTPCHSATPCRSERWYPVVLSEAKNLLRNPSETASLDMGPVCRDVAGLTSLRIKQQFSTRISVHRLSSFAYAGGDSVCPGRGRAGMGDMRRRSVIYAPSGIIGVHISMQMSRYARSTIDIRLQWHLRGAYLLWNHRWLPMWRTNVVLQILHFACGSVYGDTGTLLFRMT